MSVVKVKAGGSHEGRRAFPLLSRQTEDLGLFLEDQTEAKLSKWRETLFGVEYLLLLASPVYYGLGVPHGDGSGVILIPAFLEWESYLGTMRNWLRRIGYRAYESGIGLNAECPNLLIEHQLSQTLKKARRESGKKVHLIGHSLGGIIALSLAAQRSEDVASVITLASPFRGTVAHRTVLASTELVRKFILLQHGSKVLPECYTGHCTCDFVDSLRRQLPATVAHTAIYTRNDGMVDWRFCMTGKPEIDVAVPGTHSGLAFNPTVYTAVAFRLAQSG